MKTKIKTIENELTEYLHEKKINVA